MSKKEELLNYIRAHRLDFDEERLWTLLWGYLDEVDLQGIYETRMGPEKLYRAERIKIIDDHTIEFEIERHGAAALGSIYATMQHWRFDIANDTVDHFDGRRVQIEPQDSSFTETQALELARQVFDQIESGDRTDARVRFFKDGRVAIKISTLTPASRALRTLRGRRRRMRRALECVAVERGWELAHRPYGRQPTFVKRAADAIRRS